MVTGKFSWWEVLCTFWVHVNVILNVKRERGGRGEREGGGERERQTDRHRDRQTDR